MVNFIVFISFIGLIIGIVRSVKATRNKLPRKNALLLAGASFIVMTGTISLFPTTPKLDFAESVVETNEQGVAIISGKTNNQSEITVDGEKIDTKDDSFSYEVTLEDEHPKKITFVASVGDNDKAKTVEVTPSSTFLAFLDEKQTKKTVKNIETALEVAEDEPTQANYDEAATLIASLDRERAPFTKRLAIIKENIPIYEAVELAESKQTKEHVASATALVAKATLNKERFTERLAFVQQKITEKETTEKQLAAAREAVEKAEQEPTDEHYNQAITKIKALTAAHKSDLEKRAERVKQTLTAKKEEAKRLAEAQKKAEQEAQKIAAEQQQAAAAQTPEPPAPATQGTGEMVLVTRTGSHYHNRKCGNGTYTPATLEQAQAAGLTPCSKCF